MNPVPWDNRSNSFQGSIVNLVLYIAGIFNVLYRGFLVCLFTSIAGDQVWETGALCVCFGYSGEYNNCNICDTYYMLHIILCNLLVASLLY